MIRVAIFLTSVTLIAFGVAWFADRPGDVAVTWLGYRIETSVMVASVALLLTIIAAVASWSFVRALFRSPMKASRFISGRRVSRGHRAITRGLIAVGAGDVRLAQKSADEAARLTGEEPLALLLTAQAAQLAGERAQAERAFRAMTGRAETKLLGLRGLYIEAQRRNDADSARLYAEEAAKVSPSVGWAAQAALDFRSSASDWAGALAVLEGMKRAMPKDEYRRKRAVLLTARAMNEPDRAAARAFALEAAKLEPSLVPAAVLAGRHLAESREPRKATKLLQAAWVAHPHPDIAEAYADVKPGVSARERLKRVQGLVEKESGGVEGALAVARAALAARELTAARVALKQFASAPTQRVASLMAEIEQESGDDGRARQWMARAVHAAPDPVWTADGIVSETWLPASPVTGRIDAFAWREPVAEIGVQRPAIDPDPPTSTTPLPEDASRASKIAPEPARASRRKKDARKDLRPVEGVIPLVHAPDDPGPDDAFAADPVPESANPPADRWQRWRQMFRP